MWCVLLLAQKHFVEQLNAMGIFRQRDAHAAATVPRPAPTQQEIACHVLGLQQQQSLQQQQCTHAYHVALQQQQQAMLLRHLGRMGGPSTHSMNQAEAGTSGAECPHYPPSFLTLSP